MKYNMQHDTKGQTIIFLEGDGGLDNFLGQ